MRQIVLVFLLLCMAVNGGLAQDGVQLQRPKIGLVLSGGGAKGAAEVGALKVIEEVGVPIDFIAGTSIGSILGGLYSLGYRAEKLDSIFQSQEWLDLFVKGNLIGFFEQFTGNKDDADFSDLPIPFACVAVDLKTQREVILQSGSLARAMRASMAIPGIFKPVKVNGRLLVDGGMMNNLPVDVVKKMGADIVIAVDLTQNKHETRSFSLKKLIGIGGYLDWLVSRPDWKKYNENRELVDVYINPRMDGYGATDFNKEDIRTMMLLGEDAARQQLAALRKLAALRE